jgi:class 3 adenylate cyclase/tetratricopeptide (TPR) repeat protein
MREALPADTHKIGLRVHENCFVAADAVRWIISTYNASKEHAILLGKALELEGLIAHVSLRLRFDDSPTLLYRYTIPETVMPSFSLIGSALSSNSLALAPQHYHKSFWNVDLPARGTAGDRRILNRVASYVPNIVLRQFASGFGRIEPPLMDTSPSALLFADISGFTSLTEKLASLGGRGVEKLTSHLNEYFGLMIALIYNHGGDIVKFAGDALLVIWPTSEEAGLKYSAQVATQCAAALRDELKNFKAGDVPLTLHVGVGVGYVTGIHVGGVANRMEFIIAGNPLEQAAHCEESAKPGEVFISHEVYSLISPSIQVKAPKKSKWSGADHPENYKLEQIFKPMPLSQVSVPIDPNSRAMIEQYVPAAVTAHLNSGSPDEFLAEIRTVSVLFVNLGLKFEVPNANVYSPQISQQLDRLQNAVVAMQECVVSCKGTIRQFIIDDKGSVLIAAFGLPPLSHEDDAIRAIRAATLISARLKKELSIDASIGITTGKAFCGAVGSEERREYAMVGDIVNLSARLMAKASGIILCDRATYQSASSRFRFKSLPPITVKGKTKPIDIFSPQSELTPSRVTTLRANGSDMASLQTRNSKGDLSTSSSSRGLNPLLGNTLIGRTKEMEILTSHLKSMEECAESARTKDKKTPARLVIVEGDAGAGKTKVVVELSKIAREKNLNCITGSAFSMDSLSPYYCWRDIVSVALGLEARSSRPKLSVESDPSADADTHVRTVTATTSLKRLRSEWLPFAPLLRAVLPELQFPENDISKTFVGPARAQKTIELCVQLIQASSFDIVVLENAQWMDSMSWTLALHLLKVWGPHRMLVVSIRPPLPGDTSTVATEYKSLKSFLKGDDSTRSLLSLGPLHASEVKQFVANRFGLALDNVPGNLVHEVMERSTGNPMLVQEVLSVMQKEGELVLDGNGGCQLVLSDQFSLKRAMSGAQSAVSALITSKIDQLPTSQQLILKIAAVIGREFPIDLLYDVLKQISTIEYEAQVVVQHLEELEMSGFILEVQQSPPVFCFASGMVPDVLYNLMLFSQRKAVHEKVAEWLEANEATQGPIQIVLAYHWKRAESWAKALAFMSKCAVRSMSQGAFMEAISMFLDCVETAKHLAGSEAVEQVANMGSWYRMIGESYFALGNAVKAIKAFEDGLRMLRVHIPSAGLSSVKETSSDLVKRMKALKDHGSIDDLSKYLWAPESNKKQQSIIDSGGREIVLMYKALSVLKFWTGYRAEGFFSALEATKRASRLDMRIDYVEAISLVIFSCSGSSIQDIGEDLIVHVGRVSTLLPKGNLAVDEALAKWHMCSAAHLGAQARWKQAQESNNAAIKLAVTCDRPRIVGESTISTLFLLYFQGNFSALEAHITKALELAASRNDEKLRLMIMCIKTHLLLSQGHHKGAMKQLNEIEATRLGSSKASDDDIDVDAPSSLGFSDTLVNLLTLSARVLLMSRNDKGTDLQDSAQQLLDFLEARDPTSLFSSFGYFSLAEAAVALHRSGRASNFFVEASMGRLSAYANTFPFAVGILHLFQGDLEKVQNKNDFAVSKWTQASQFSKQVGAAYFEACAQYRLGDTRSVELATAAFKEMGVLPNRFLQAFAQ